MLNLVILVVVNNKSAVMVYLWYLIMFRLYYVFRNQDGSDPTKDLAKRIFFQMKTSKSGDAAINWKV